MAELLEVSEHAELEQQAGEIAFWEEFYLTAGAAQ